jgi:hypothetical protein
VATPLSDWPADAAPSKGMTFEDDDDLIEIPGIASRATRRQRWLLAIGLLVLGVGVYAYEKYTHVPAPEPALQSVLPTTHTTQAPVTPSASAAPAPEVSAAPAPPAPSTATPPPKAAPHRRGTRKG